MILHLSSLRKTGRPLSLPFSEALKLYHSNNGRSGVDNVIKDSLEFNSLGQESEHSMPSFLKKTLSMKSIRY